MNNTFARPRILSARRIALLATTVAGLGALALAGQPLLTPAEVASMFRVDPKTVTRWAKAGKLSAIRTLGGHRRYRESEVRALLQGQIPAQRVGD